MQTSSTVPRLLGGGEREPIADRLRMHLIYQHSGITVYLESRISIGGGRKFYVCVLGGGRVLIFRACSTSKFLGHAPLIGLQSSHVGATAPYNEQCERAQRSFLEPAQDTRHRY